MQGPACRRRWAFHVLLVIVAAALVVLGFSGRGLLGRPEREVIQEVVIHHFERAAWFALHADEYKQLGPGLGREFREMAEWHYRRARDYQRSDPAGLAAALDLDARHDRGEGKLMDRALKAKMR